MLNENQDEYEHFAHMAWCGIIAADLAWKYGTIKSLYGEHFFLTRWLATSLKKRTFPRCVASELNSLIDMAKREGPNAKLYQKLKNIWYSCTGNVLHREDVFRLTYLLSVFKDEGWETVIGNKADWPSTSTLLDGSILFLEREPLRTAFSVEGKLVTPLELFIKGDFSAVACRLDELNFHYQYYAPLQDMLNGCWQFTIAPL